MPTLEEAIEYIRTGNREEGRQVLEEILETNESDEEVWLWLSSVVDTDEDREICLENVLALNPDNVVALKGLEALQAGSFDVNDMLSEVLESQEEEDDGGTFIDDFVTADDFDEFDLNDDLTLPSTMQAKAGGLASKINLRVIILLTIILLLVLVALGGAAFFMFNGGSGGDGTPAETLPAQSVPSEQATVDASTPTLTPTPGPTDTPTHTPTPVLQLPTSVPTKEPTPTSTRVVSPTPAR